MTEDELNAIVESKLADRLAARLQADRERVRAEVVAELRREEDRKWYDRINRKHPIENQYSGLTREQHEERLREMRRRAAADNAAMDEANARVPEGAVTRGSRADSKGGSAGFRVKPPGGM
jgi:hypothetical protein